MGTRHDFSEEILTEPSEDNIFPHYVPPSNGAKPTAWPADHVDYRGSEQHGVPFNHMTQIHEREDSAGTAHVNSIDQKDPYKVVPYEPVPVVIVKDHTVSQGSVVGFTGSRIVQVNTPVMLLGADPFRTRLIISVACTGSFDSVIISTSPISISANGGGLTDNSQDGMPVVGTSNLEINTTGPIWVSANTSVARVGYYVESRQGSGNKIVDHK